MSKLNEELNRMVELSAINEGFKEKKSKWLKQNSGLLDKDVEQYFDTYKALKKKNVLKGKDKDIDSFKSWSDFKKFVDSNKTKKSKREKLKDAIIHFDNGEYRIIEPKTHEASCKYGTGTKWCVSVAGNDAHWKTYSSRDIKFIFVDDYSENKLKYALAIYPHQKGEKPAIEAFDIDDKPIKGPEWIIKHYNIPKRLLLNIPKPKTWAWFVTHVGEEKFKVHGDTIIINGNVNIGDLGLVSLSFS